MTLTDQIYGREGEILAVIRGLPKTAVVVGGYAVNAYSLQPRTSVDLDVVIPDSELPVIREMLKSRGYKRDKTWGPEGRRYGGRAERHIKGVGGMHASVDILVNSLCHRDTGAEWPYELIRRDSKTGRIACRTGYADAMVASPEMLIAMKLHSFRKPDRRDIGMMLLANKVDAAKIARLAGRGDLDALLKNINTMAKEVESKAYADSFKGVFGYGQSFDLDSLKKRIIPVLRELGAEI